MSELYKLQSCQIDWLFLDLCGTGLERMNMWKNERVVFEACVVSLFKS